MTLKITSYTALLEYIDLFAKDLCQQCFASSVLLSHEFSCDRYCKKMREF